MRGGREKKEKEKEEEEEGETITTTTTNKKRADKYKQQQTFNQAHCVLLLITIAYLGARNRASAGAGVHGTGRCNEAGEASNAGDRHRYACLCEERKRGSWRLEPNEQVTAGHERRKTREKQRQASRRRDERHKQREQVVCVCVCVWFVF